MINTRDEILFAFAANILDIVPPPPVPTFEPKNDEEEEQIEEQEEEEVQEPTSPPEIPVQPVPQFIEPIPVTQPVGVDQEIEDFRKDFDVAPADRPWIEQNAGSPEWAAENYPYAYLKGHDPFLGYAADAGNSKVTENLMNRIVTDEPEKYFEWGLFRKSPGNDPAWMRKASEQMIDTDVDTALVLQIFAFFHRKELTDLLPKMWEKAIESELNKSAETTSGDIFPGVLHSRMRALLKKIAEEQPEFYSTIEDSPYVERFRKGEPRRSPISQREDTNRGSLVWLAKHYPKTYLRGNDIWQSKRTKDGRDEEATQIAMDNLIEYNPIKYFEWGLRRPHDLKQWMTPAIRESVKRHPHEVLMFDLYKQGPEIYKVLPDLWNNLMKFEKERTKNMPETQLFQDRIFNKMRRLAGEIARTHPDFYDTIPKIFKTSQFNDWARNALEGNRNNK